MVASMDAERQARPAGAKQFDYGRRGPFKVPGDKTNRDGAIEIIDTPGERGGLEKTITRL